MASRYKMLSEAKHLIPLYCRVLSKKQTEDFYLVKDRDSGDDIGYVTSAFWSPNMESNIALAVMPRSYWRTGIQVKVQLDGIVDAEVVRVPFFDPTKERPKSTL